MRQIRLGVLENDGEYMAPMKAYFRSANPAAIFSFIVFTKADAIQTYCADSGKLDILLIGSSYLAEAPSLTKLAHVCCEFGEEWAPSGESEAGTELPFVAKYQPMDQLTAALEDMAVGQAARALVMQSDSSRVISVYSASGGCGKTMAAWNLAGGLAYFGSKTLLVSLEAIQSELPFGPASGEDRFGKLLYYLKAEGAGLSARLTGLTQLDPRSGLSYLEPLPFSGDLNSLSGADTNDLITALKSAGYDYVILDLSSSLDERTAAALAASDAILWLVADDAGCLAKTHKALREWEREAASVPLRNKILLGVNRYTGTMSNPIELGGLSPDFYLPYIPEWKSVTSLHQLLADSTIQDTLTSAVSRFLTDKEEACRA